MIIHPAELVFCPIWLVSSIMIIIIKYNTAFDLELKLHSLETFSFLKPHRVSK